MEAGMLSPDDLDRITLFESAREKAAADYARNPRDADNLTRWGGALLESAQFQHGHESITMLEDAESKLEEALKLNPKMHNTLWYLGKAQASHGFLLPDTESANKLFMKASKCFQLALEEIEQQVNEIIQFFSFRGSLSKEREKDKNGFPKKHHTDASRREAAFVKRMGELMRQFGTILRQITNHKWAWPFMNPVDVKGLNLHDYYDVIKKPMDFGTIRDKMDAKDGTGYKHVQEICDDVRLVFSNAMTYNQEGTDVHKMAKTLSEKFEDKWKTVLEPKVIEEDLKRRQEEKEEDLENVQLAEEAAMEKHACELNLMLDEISRQLEFLRQKVASQCRMMTTEEKRTLGQNLSQLTPEDLSRAIQLIAQKNPNFKATGEEVEVDIDAQDASTLWRLQYFVKAVMLSQNKGINSRSPVGGKVRRPVSDTLVKPKKRSRKSSP